MKEYHLKIDLVVVVVVHIKVVVGKDNYFVEHSQVVEMDSFEFELEVGRYQFEVEGYLLEVLVN